MGGNLVEDDAAGTDGAFRHEALLYAGDDGFLTATIPFLNDGLDAGQPALVVVSAPRISILKSALAGSDDQVLFADMASVGRNPARIIPTWRTFVDRHASDGRTVRGIGEPIWPTRTPAELVECQRHEALLNVAFAESSPWWLMCTFDVDALAPDVVDDALRSHPFVRGVAGESAASSEFRAEEMISTLRSAPLPEPTRCLESLTFQAGQLVVVRALTEARAVQFGLAEQQLDDLVLAVHEIAANTVRHGGGQGRFRLWRDGRSLVAEISDRGTFDDPLAGREEPGASSTRGRGLWIANQVCDLVQIRAFPSGSVVRLYISLDGGG